MSLEINNYIEYEERTHAGLLDEHNHDFSGVFETKNGTVSVLCGGIKDIAGASIASKIAVKSIGEYFKNKKYKNHQKALYNAILFANQQIFEQAGKNPKLKGMATTIVATLLVKNQLYYAYVGNSRIYLLKNNKLQRLSKDHTKAQLMVDAGTITKEEYNNHDRKHELTNVLGKSRDLQFSICKSPVIVFDNDQLLLTSDGITNQLNDDEILKALTEEDISVKHKTAKLIDKTIAKGGKDNATAILMRYDSKIPTEIKKKKGKKVNPLFYIIPLAAIIAGVGIYFLIIYKVPQNAYLFMKEKFKKEESVLDTIQQRLQEQAMENMDSSLSGQAIIDEASLLQDTVIEYKVKKDENLFRIGLHFNIPADQLAQFNSINATSISEGQKIKIPVRGIYVVKKDDLIYQVAKKFNVNYKSIIDANKLNTYEYLVEGSELYIPYEKGKYVLN